MKEKVEELRAILKDAENIMVALAQDKVSVELVLSNVKKSVGIHNLEAFEIEVKATLTQEL